MAPALRNFREEGAGIRQTEIRMNFEQARTQARALEAQSGKLSQLSGGMAGVCRSLEVCFRGDAAARWQKEAAELQRMLQAAGRELSAEAAQLRKIAGRIYEAELQAIACWKGQKGEEG